MSGLRNNFQPVLAEDAPRSQNNVERRDSGPLKDIIAQQDSLYKYISWEDPARTIGSYFAALGFMLAVHHMHLTQLVLKTMAIGLGVMSMAEFAGRSFGPNNFVSRMRPRQYKTVPESTLNATLKDIHDFIQYAVVQAQKVIFAEDLEKTFGAFVATGSLYFLIQFMTPFGIAILGLTTIYIIPLVTSPRGRGIARDGMARAQEISNAAVDQANSIAQDPKGTMANISSMAQDTAGNLRQRAVNMVPGSKQTENRADVTSTVAHNSSGPTQARDISSKFPQEDSKSSEQSKHSASMGSHGTSSSFDRSPIKTVHVDPSQTKDFSQSSFDSSSSQSKDTPSTFSHSTTDDFPSNTQPALGKSKENTPSFSHSATGSLPSYGQATFSKPQDITPSYMSSKAKEATSSYSSSRPDDTTSSFGSSMNKDMSSGFSLGTTNDFSPSSKATSNFPPSRDKDMPDYAQHRKSLNYSKFPHVSNDNSDMQSGSTTLFGNQAPTGKKPSIDETNYSLQNRTDMTSDYQHFVPREAPNRGILGSQADTSMGKMPLGELLDEKKQAGDKAPPISAGGLNAME
ncbi:uncharacterized protein FSUBG_13605 [Fusarium subglutinans]|uniref:Reticulon domain-containing protein n=1 Tax=Gibberella subglutinans TaxID=42677 RepID=A0A8H5KWW6_GIBSU|nr:uncharacterized protein FSUBG_13605 [Fusarium subglutinans]KAF5579485.1 hypothetical protein FSUBG_13605 [Fusarium subglutinans]